MFHLSKNLINLTDKTTVYYNTFSKIKFAIFLLQAFIVIGLLTSNAYLLDLV